MLNSSYYASMKDLNSVPSLKQTSSLQENSTFYHPLSQSYSNLSLRQKIAQLKQNEKSSLKVVICRRYNSDVKKLRALVNNEKGKWILWEITDQSADIITKIRTFFEDD